MSNFCDNCIRADSKVCAYCSFSLSPSGEMSQPSHFCQKHKKPPLGLTPRFIRDEQRLNEILAAIERYAAEKTPIPLEWVEEYNEICIRLQEEDK